MDLISVMWILVILGMVLAFILHSMDELHFGIFDILWISVGTIVIFLFLTN